MSGVVASMDARRAELAASMPGFAGLIEATQGLLIGWSLATGEIPATRDAGQTREFALAITREYVAMVEAWGVEA